jgi:RNA polymerase sigma factor (sigma-70 family)
MDRNPTETARKTAEEALSRLAAELEAGRSETLTNVLAAMSQFWRYSWDNVLLISAQRPNATRVAGIHNWNDLGRSIKKGEKGIVVFARGAAKKESTHRPAPQDNPFPTAGARAAYVFDVSQTEGKPIPELRQTPGDPTQYVQQLKEEIAKRGIDLTPRPELSPEQEFRVLIHELTPEMLHRQKEAAAFSRDLIGAQAEAVAYVVSRGLGLEPHNTAAVLLARGVGDKKALAESLTIVQKTAAQILDELLPEEGIYVRHAAAAVAKERYRLDAEAFGRIHNEYGNRLVNSITGFVQDRDKAEDIAARAFQVAWAKREQFRGEASPQTWIQTIARNEARQSWSRERTVPLDSIDRDDAREIPATELVADSLEKQEERLRVQNALGRLPTKFRRALTAHFIDGLSVREISHRERVPLGTVLSRIFTAKQLLRQAWESSPVPVKSDVGLSATFSASWGHRSAAPETSQSNRSTTNSPEPAHER